jgi:hypothetical protein
MSTASPLNPYRVEWSGGGTVFLAFAGTWLSSA